VVKNIGDEVLYAFAGAEDAVEVSLRLAEIHHYDETLPEVRVAVGFGPVLNREGDLYGPMVNKVSRVVPVCRPGRVLVTREAAGELAGNPRFVLDALRPRVLKDIGREQLWRVRLVSDPPPGPRLERTNPFGVIKDRLSGR
jgi:adenylate cyclase